MQTRSKILEDLSKMAQGATQSLVGVKAEIDALVHGQMAKLLANMNLVEREEFDAVKAMAAKARAENEKLEARIKALEAQLPGKAPAAKPAAKKAAPKKAPPKEV